MGFLSDTLFGTETEVEPSQLPLLSPEQQTALNELLSFLGEPGEAEQFGRGLELTSLQALEDLSRSFAEPGGGPLAGATSAVSDLLRGSTGETAGFDQFFEEAIAQPLMERFQEDVLPGLSRRFAQSGFRSSDRLRQETAAVEELAQALTQGRAQFGFTARENALNRALEAARLSPALAALPVEVQNLINQASKRAESQRLNALLGAINTRALENLVTVSPGAPGAIQEFLTGAAGTFGEALGTRGGKIPGGRRRTGTTAAAQTSPFILE